MWLRGGPAVQGLEVWPGPAARAPNTSISSCAKFSLARIRQDGREACSPFLADEGYQLCAHPGVSTQAPQGPEGNRRMGYERRLLGMCPPPPPSSHAPKQRNYKQSL